MEKAKKELKNQLSGLKFSEPLGKYTTFQIGGPADYFYQLRNMEELPSIVQFCHIYKIPIFIFGSGSNILFSDKGLRGFAIKLEAENIEFDLKNCRVKADGGVLVSKLINESIKHKLSGFEQWIGLPGTIGGAVRGNAGCNGLETKDILVCATLMDQNSGHVHEANCKYFHYAYRHSKIKETREIVLDATLQLKSRKMSAKKQKEIMDEIRKERARKQPFGLTTGSFFKNPLPDQPAGMLIENVGLKGKTIGKARISDKHGNFFINLRGATAKDMIKLMNLAKKEVHKRFGLELEEEVQIVPEKFR